MLDMAEASVTVQEPALTGRGIRWLSTVLACLTFLLIGLGGVVNTTGSGLSVPDWPTTYGRHLFLYPPSEWRGGILYEHTHRLVAALVGLLSFVHVLWSWLMFRGEQHRWFRMVSLGAFFLVLLQGILGGLTVLFRLPTAISTSHAMVAHTFFAGTLVLALGTQRSWYALPESVPAVEHGLLRLSAVTWAVTFVQVLFGALTRHTYSALAIPDFPLVFGGLVPPASAWNYQVLLHYVHRVVGFVLAALMVWQGIWLWRRWTPGVSGIGVAGIVVVIVQILLGGWLVWSFRSVFPTALHGITGTAIWALNTLIFVRLWRWRWLARQHRS